MTMPTPRHVDRRVRRLVRAKRKLIALLTEQKQAIIHRAVTRGLDPDVPLAVAGLDADPRAGARGLVALPNCTNPALALVLDRDL